MTDLDNLDRWIDSTLAKTLLAKAIPNGDCLDCHYTPKDTGYCKVGSGADSAHRVVFKGVKGIIPLGMLVLHTCDNRRCIRPEHLFIGTHQDNMDDMQRKGRGVVGFRSTAPNEALKVVTNTMLSRMKKLEREKFSQRQIAAEMSVSQNTVFNYLRGYKTPIEGS